MLTLTSQPLPEASRNKCQEQQALHVVCFLKTVEVYNIQKKNYSGPHFPFPFLPLFGERGGGGGFIIESKVSL